MSISNAQLRRCWINQPSSLQPLNSLHGLNVLSVPDGEAGDRIYFLSGDIISMQVPKGVLSDGWRD